MCRRRLRYASELLLYDCWCRSLLLSSLLLFCWLIYLSSQRPQKSVDVTIPDRADDVQLPLLGDDDDNVPLGLKVTVPSNGMALGMCRTHSKPTTPEWNAVVEPEIGHVMCSLLRYFLRA